MTRLVFALLLSLASAVCMAADVPHYGDFTDDDAVHDFPLSTFNVSTGALATVTNVADGTSAITVVHVDSATAITTLDTIDLDVGVTGNHVVTLDFSAATLSAGIYEVRITDADATVGSLAVTNFPIFRFSVAQYTSSAGVESIVDTRADTTDGLIGDVQTDVDTLVTGVNVSSISGDTAAADNAEKFYENGSGFGVNIFRTTVASVVTPSTVLSLTDAPASNSFTGCRVVIRDVTGDGIMTAVITSYGAGEATIDPDGTAPFTIAAGDIFEILPPAYGGEDRTAATTAQTKVGFLPSATAGSAGGVFIAGTNAATTVTTAFTTTFTGNLTGSIGSLGADAISASSIAADAIGASELAASAIGTSELATGAFTTDEFAAGAITASAIATDAITSAEIATDAIGEAEVADATLDEAAFDSGVLFDPETDEVIVDSFGADAITASSIAADAIGASEIATDAIGSAEIAASAIAASEIAADAITSSEIAASAIGSSELATDSISNDEIATTAATEIGDEAGGNGASNVLNSGQISTINSETNFDFVLDTTGTIAADSWIDCEVIIREGTQAATRRVTDNTASFGGGTEINITTASDVPWTLTTAATVEVIAGTGSVADVDEDLISDTVWAETARTLTSGAITADTIAADAIGASELASAAIAADEIAADAIGASELAADSIGASEIASAAIAADEIASDAIGAAELAADAIGSSELASAAIAADEIAADAIGASEMAADAIGASEIAADAITATEIANGTIDAATFAAGAIDATAVANGTIDAATFASGAIDATAIATDAIGAAEIAADAITASETSGIDIGAILGTSLSETSAGNLAGNVGIFFDNDDAATTRIVDDVAGATLTEEQIDDIADAISTAVPDTRDLRPVAPTNTWKMVQRGSGVISANTITIYQGETKRCSFNLKDVLPAGEVLASMGATPTASVANLTPTKLGIDEDDAKITLACGAAVAAGTYNVRTTITTDPDTGPILIIGTVKVLED
jgi:hypothetical protein